MADKVNNRSKGEVLGEEHRLDGLTAEELPECSPTVVFQPSQSPAAWSAQSDSLQGRTRTEAGFDFIEYAFI